MYPQRSKISKPRVPFFPSPSPELLTRDPAGINEESPLRISVGSGGEGGGVSRFVGWRGLWIPNPAYIRFASNCMQFDAANGAEKGRREEGGRAVKLLAWNLADTENRHRRGNVSARRLYSSRGPVRLPLRITRLSLPGILFLSFSSCSRRFGDGMWISLFG